MLASTRRSHVRARGPQPVLAWENAGFSLEGHAALVSDNPDRAGDFEADAEEIAKTILASRQPEHLSLWASEQLLKPLGVDALALQPQQPLVMAMNCLNGFFHLPAGNSLAEKLVKAQGKGAIAAFSSSGMSFNDAAHRYHSALLAQIVSGDHERLGDALLAAQAQYADTGADPELLALYHLLGDPALRIR